MLPSKNKPWLLVASAAAIAFLVAGIVMAALLVTGVGSAETYGILFPDVWTDRLAFANSTGQYDVITEYRNATYHPYDNLTLFINGPAVGAISQEIAAASQEITGTPQEAVADPQYRCVEYAVRLHDEAERQGFSCMVVSTSRRPEATPHALVAFRTTDLGMLFVDPAAANVSAPDYPGIAFSRVVLLRNQWKAKLPVPDAAGINLTMTERRKVSPVPFGELKAFLAEDDTEARPYVLPNYTCLDFAVTLHDRAEAAGIPCGVVTVGFTDRNEGHAFNAFPTTDRGVVYVDSTGVNATGGTGATRATDNVVYLLNGSELGELPLGQADLPLDYGYYLDQKGRIDAYRERWLQYEADVLRYNAEVEEHDARLAENQQHYAAYRDERDRYAAALDEYNRQMDLHNNAVMDFNEGDTEVAIPEVPPNSAELEAWREGLDDRYDRYQSTRSQLEAWRVELIGRKAALDARMAALQNAGESKLITYSPMGIVDDIEIFWG